MKKLMLFCFLLAGPAGFTQITLDFQTAINDYLQPVKLTNDETKYYLQDQVNLNSNQVFSLYNLDGTLYKTIQMPPKPNPAAFSYYANMVSRTLFDTDPATIEYAIDYIWDSAGYTQHDFKVIREDGTILLDEMHGQGYGVYATEEGTKLMVSSYWYANGAYLPYYTRVFDLPGQIPTEVQDHPGKRNGDLLVYPNPNNGSFSITFGQGPGEDRLIRLFAPDGKLLSTYRSSGDPVRIDSPGLPDGLYYISAGSKDRSASGKMIIKK